MNGEHAPTEVTESREQHSYARVPRRWLLLARIGWAALLVLTMAIFFASLPVYIACVRSGCSFSSQQLTPEQVEVLKGSGFSPDDYIAYTVALTLASVVLCLVVSALIAWRRSDDRMALLVALLLVTLGPVSATSSVSETFSPWRLPAACLYFLTLALLVLVFLLFPSGRFVPRWTRWTFVVFLVGQIPSTFFPYAPFTLDTNASQVGFLMLVGEAAILVVVQFYRYRRVSSTLERQQTKWVVFGMAIPISVFVSGTVLEYIFPALNDPSSLYSAPYQLALNASTCLTLLIPLSFGFAMLHSRLWDIDILINRTLVYGTLTVILTVVYVGLVIGLSALLHGIISKGNGVAIVLSTLAIYFLFQPLRRRIQRSIDRRFYRSKYDAAKTLAAFSATLRNEVDLEQLREQLLGVVEETMQPAHVSLWLRTPEHCGKQRAPWRATPPAP